MDSSAAWRSMARAVRFLPIVERELRVASRGRGPYRWRTMVVGMGLLLMGYQTLSMASWNAAAEVQGGILFNVLVGLSSLYALLAGLTVTADCVSREKREGTLGLLFLTDQRGTDIIFGKLAASSLNTIYGLFGLLPLLGIPIMLGGVSIQAGILAALAVVNLLFFALSFGILVSTLSWDERRATFASVVGGLAMLVAPFLAGGLSVWFFGRGPAESFLVSALSPAFPLIAMLPRADANGALLSLLPSHVLGWVALVLAARFASRSWHSRSGSPVRRTVDERVFASANPEARRRHRRNLLDAHPLVWLLERHPGKRFYADGLVFSIMAIWVWGYRNYGTDMFGGPTWFLIIPLAVVVHMILATWVVAESSMRLIEDRRSGALELMLCTSMSDDEIIRGYRLALRRLFLRPVLLLAAAEVFVAFTGFGDGSDDGARAGRNLLLAAALALLLDTQGLSWIALRLAVSLPTVNRVGAYALAITPIGPALLCAVLVTAWNLTWGVQRGNLNASQVVAVWIACVAFVNLVFAQGFSRSMVRRDFRAAAIRVQPKVATAG